MAAPLAETVDRLASLPTFASVPRAELEWLASRPQGRSRTSASMTQDTSMLEGSPAWERDVRAREEEARSAFLAADLEALDALWAEEYTVNSPLQQVLSKRQVLDLLRAGRIRHSAYEQEIEHMSRRGDVVVVMGRDSVVDPPDGVRSRRRFTNIWRLEGGVWRSIGRHAHVVVREVTG